MIVAEKALPGTTCTERNSPSWQLCVGWLTCMSSKPTAAVPTVVLIQRRTLLSCATPSNSLKTTSPSLQPSDWERGGNSFSISRSVLSFVSLYCNTIFKPTPWARPLFPKLIYRNFTETLRERNTFSMTLSYMVLSRVDVRTA